MSAQVNKNYINSCKSCREFYCHIKASRVSYPTKHECFKNKHCQTNIKSCRFCRLNKYLEEIEKQSKLIDRATEAGLVNLGKENLAPAGVGTGVGVVAGQIRNNQNNFPVNQPDSEEQRKLDLIKTLQLLSKSQAQPSTSTSSHPSPGAIQNSLLQAVALEWQKVHGKQTSTPLSSTTRQPLLNLKRRGSSDSGVPASFGLSLSNSHDNEMRCNTSASAENSASRSRSPDANNSSLPASENGEAEVFIENKRIKLSSVNSEHQDKNVNINEITNPILADLQAVARFGKLTQGQSCEEVKNENIWEKMMFGQSK